MNHLIGKTKGKSYIKIISDQRIYSLPSQIGDAINFSSSYILEEDEWFKIENFSEQSFCMDLLRESFNSTQYPQYCNADMENITYICSYQNDNEFYFQRIKRSQLISKKMLSIGDNVCYEDNKKCIIINEVPDAIYLRDKNILYFKDLSSITAIFNGIDAIFREATQEEVDEFLKSDFIRLNEGYSTDKVGTRNRKRIALAIETLKKMSLNEKQQVFRYVAQYCPKLNFIDNSFLISSESELKALLYGIEQRYFTTPIGGEKRMANSVIKIN